MTSSHDNSVKITCSAIQSIQYLDNSLVITNGQPSSPPPSISQSGDTWTITMNCGRKGSSAVANSFSEACGGKGRMYCPDAISDTSPGELNFYFAVRVGFNLGGENYYVQMYLAQGHRTFTNNWWIGGRYLAYKDLPILNIAALPSSDLEQVYTISGGVSDFKLSPWLNTSNLPEQPRWLKDLPNDRLISDINLPGTHDSAAINQYIYTPYACHSNTLSSQMRYGVRLLDIRLSVHQDNTKFTFITCHGDIGPNEYQTFTSALDECKTFLNANPTEFIAMSLKVDDWNNVTDKQGAYNALASLLSSYPNYTSADIPKLSDVRGKIYLMNRINSNLNLGVPISWKDNTSGSWSSAQANRNFQLYVQDKYEDLGDSSTSAEKEKYNLFIEALPITSSGQMLLDYASGTQAKIMGVYIMAPVLSYFGDKAASQRPTRLGWTLWDYITTSYATDIYGKLNILQMLIASNFSYRGYEQSFKVDEGHDEL